MTSYLNPIARRNVPRPLGAPQATIPIGYLAKSWATALVLLSLVRRQRGHGRVADPGRDQNDTALMFSGMRVSDNRDPPRGVAVVSFVTALVFGERTVSTNQFVR